MCCATLNIWNLWFHCLLERLNKDTVAGDIEKSIQKKFRKKIWSKFTKAINQYQLVLPGDKIAVCISGGKDSMLMAKLFQELKRHSKFDFDVEYLVMDPGYSPANRKIIEGNAKKLNIILSFKINSFLINFFIFIHIIFYIRMFF